MIADYLRSLDLPRLISSDGTSGGVVVFSVYGLLVLFYMDFSGYTDIAIGSARLFGYKITENFNRPFLKPNIALFWRNWHISFYVKVNGIFLPTMAMGAR